MNAIVGSIIAAILVAGGVGYSIYGSGEPEVEQRTPTMTPDRTGPSMTPEKTQKDPVLVPEKAPYLVPEATPQARPTPEPVSPMLVPGRIPEPMEVVEEEIPSPDSKLKLDKQDKPMPIEKEPYPIPDISPDLAPQLVPHIIEQKIPEIEIIIIDLPRETLECIVKEIKD